MDEITKKLKEHDKRFDAVDERLDLLDKQVDVIARTVVDHTERLDRIEEKMVTKNEIGKISNTLDTLVSLARKKDQEMTMMTRAIRRIGDDVEKIKPLIGLA